MTTSSHTTHTIAEHVKSNLKKNPDYNNIEMETMGRNLKGIYLFNTSLLHIYIINIEDIKIEDIKIRLESKHATFSPTRPSKKVLFSYIN